MHTILTTKTGKNVDIHVFTVPEYISSNELQKARRTRIRGDYKQGIKQFAYDNIITFDIETSRIQTGTDEKGKATYFTFMYHWQMCIDGCVVFGRTWDEFNTILLFIHQTLQLDDDNKAIIFVHNLAYEMSFLYYRLPIKDIFAIAPHEPIKVKLSNELSGFEFRCTYTMTGKSLEQLAKDTISCPFYKDKEEIDYTQVFTPKQPIYPSMVKYCAKDVLIPFFYLRELLKTEINLYNIPITKTGFVRRACRKAIHNNNEWNKYKRTQKITPEQYYYLTLAFRGGDTHSNAIYNGQFVELFSQDISSSYPTRLLTCEFPASPPMRVENMNQHEFEMITKYDFLWFGKVVLYDVKVKSGMFNYIPKSKCDVLTNDVIIDNGRVHSCTMLSTVITNIDFEIIKENYTFKLGKIPLIFYYTHKKLLPLCFRQFILDLYKTKTQLKGQTSPDGSIEKKYALSKEQINSVYGMSVTHQLHDTITLQNHEWIRTEKDPSRFEEFETEYQKELDKISNFLPYSIGVFTTAYARQDLFTGLKLCGTDAVYWDTDSVKYINPNHTEQFSQLNEQKLQHLYTLYDKDEIAPQDIKGIRHPIGLWENEYPKGVKFCTFGAKKYCYEDNATGKGHVTISGLSKKLAHQYLINKYGTVTKLDIGEVFDENNSGRTISQYSLFPYETVINGEKIREESYMNIVPTTYTLGTTTEYKLYIKMCMMDKGITGELSELKALKG